MKALHRWLTIALPIAVVVQITFVGVGAFHAAQLADDNKINKDNFESWFGLHAGFGYILVLVALIYVAVSLATRDRARMKMSGIALGLFVGQVLLAWVSFAVPALGWSHPLNALLILGFTGRNALAEWKAREAVEAAPVGVPA
jgi:hypothetical protein